MKLEREFRRALRGVLPVALLALLLASPAGADSLLVQPDGKIVLTGTTWPEFGALARLQPNGTLDPSFGQGGFVIDQRTAGFPEIALQPDGRIVSAAAAGPALARYLPDGVADPSFGGDGLGESELAAQAPGGYRPSALVVGPDGSFVVGANFSLAGGGSEAWIRRYDGAGSLVETVGRVPQLGGAADASYLNDILEGPEGSLLGVGSTYEVAKPQTLPFLARFLPGSGTSFDPAFASGAGLARPSFPSKPRFYPGFSAVATAGNELLAAGTTAGTFLLARFDSSGNLDPSFGEGGFVAPPIAGPSEAASKYALEEAASGAGDLAVMPDGDIVLGGGTSQWGTWTFTKMLGLRCTDCPQPMLARFDSSGNLDPSFGSGGLLRLLKPDGSTFLGGIQQVTALADGKILVNGYFGKPFVARLNPDGSYDPSFGEGGLTTLQYPCSDQNSAEQRRAGCVPAALLTLGLRGLRRGWPALSLQVAPNLPWAAVGQVALTLPRGVRPTRKLRSRLRMTAVGAAESGGKVRVVKPKEKRGKTVLLFEGFGEARELQVKLGGGSLRTFGRNRLRRGALRMRMDVRFADATFRDYFETTQTLVRRVSTS